MKNLRATIRTALLAAFVISLAVCPLSYFSKQAVASANASQPFGTVPPPQPDFDSPFTVTPEAVEGFESVGPLDATPLSEIPADQLDDYILIGDQAYRIGDEFLDRSGIETGPETKDTFGWYGYATISSNPDHKLIWYTDASGEKHYMIVRADDELFTGTPGVDNGDGFDDYVRELQEAESAIAAASALYGGAIGGAILTQIALCGPTGGATCVSGLITAFVAAVGSASTMAYNYLFKMLPAENNIVEQFNLIDNNRP